MEEQIGRTEIDVRQDRQFIGYLDREHGAHKKWIRLSKGSNTQERFCPSDDRLFVGEAAE